MPHHFLDHTLVLQILQRLSSKRSIYFQTIDEDSDGDETIGLYVLLEFIRGGLIKDDGVLGFILDYNSKIEH